MYRKKLFLYRTKRVITYFIVSFLIIFIFIAYLQVYRFAFFKQKSIANYTRHKKIESLRGTIYDCKGQVLATTRPVLRLLWNKSPLKMNDVDRSLLLFLQEKACIGVKIEELLLNNGIKYYVLENRLTFPQLSIIEESTYPNPRLSIEVYTERHYPHGCLASHAIGYLHSLDSAGISGVEKIYNDNLEGEPGIEEHIVNSAGAVINSSVINNAKKGTDIVTTIDLDIQLILEKLIPNDVKAAIIVMNAETGALRGILSSPRYDPSMFFNGITHEAMQQFNQEGVFINRCFAATYPPGSIFKLVTTIAMLEEKIIDCNNHWLCTGKFDYGERSFHCNKRTGHGLVDIVTALSFSCNIPFYKESTRSLTIDTINKYSVLLGLGNITQSPFNEKKGFIPNKAWKRLKYNEKWYSGETLSVAIGQGALEVTPIQLTVLMAGIITGYFVVPHIIEEENIIKKNLSINSSTLKIIKESIRLGVKEGTSKSLQYLLKNWSELYAKTGTSQIKKIKEKDSEEESKRFMPHGLITLYAKHPKSEPLVITIIIENSGSSRVATKYAKQFLIEYANVLRHQ